MNSCDFSVWDKFDVGACLNSLLFGWVPDWLWTLISWWPWILGGIGALVLLAVLYQVKAVFGWPGVVALLTAGAFGAGYFARGAGKEEHEQIPADHPDVVVVRPSKPKVAVPKKKRPTIFDRS